MLLKRIFNLIMAFYIVLSMPRALDKKFDEVLTQHNYSGVVLAWKPGCTIRKNYGNSDGRQIKLTDAFPIASISKTITAAVVLSEFHKRNLNVELPVASKLHLQGLPESIKVSDLLNHTSGLAQYTDFCKLDKTRTKKLSKDKLIELLTSEICPGGKFDYNNANYILLELLLESITGESYPDLLSKHVFNPLKMQNTGTVTATQVDELVIGLDKQGRKAISVDYSWLGGGAGIYSTADDLFKFASAMMNKLVVPETFFWDHDCMDYRYGWTSLKLRNEHIFLHEGGIDGFSTMLMIEPKSETILIMLSNEEIDIDNLSKKLLGLLLNRL